jgi:hypothetical protein
LYNVRIGSPARPVVAIHRVRSGGDARLLPGLINGSFNLHTTLDKEVIELKSTNLKGNKDFDMALEL